MHSLGLQYRCTYSILYVLYNYVLHVLYGMDYVHV